MANLVDLPREKSDAPRLGLRACSLILSKECSDFARGYAGSVSILTRSGSLRPRSQSDYKSSTKSITARQPDNLTKFAP